MTRIRTENAELKSKFEQKESEKTKYESKIRALEKIINTNTSYQSSSSQSKPLPPPPPPPPPQMTTPSSSHRNISNNIRSQAAIPSQSASSMSTNPATHGGSLETPSSVTSSGMVGSRVNRLIADSRSSTVSGPNNSSSSTGSTTGSRSQIGSIANNAAFNRFQTPSKNNGTGREMLARDGRPVANRKQQRRSKSVETWIDHKPPATPKIGKNPQKIEGFLIF